MSGGSYDYKFQTLDDYYVGRMHDKEMDELLKDLIEVLHDLEWWISCDIDEDQYRKTLSEFKNKWIRQNETQIVERLTAIIDSELDRTRRQLTKML